MGLLRAAIAEVADDRRAQRKLARAATSRAHCEMEWVYEIFGTEALESSGAHREASLGGRARADLQLGETSVEFKSAQAHFAIPEAFDGTAPLRDRADEWLGKDLRRMSACGGLFVLVVSTVQPPATSRYADSDLDELREAALARYTTWLGTRVSETGALPLVVRLFGGAGSYAGQSAVHDLLVVRWDGS